MAGRLAVILMAGLLGAGSFGIAMLPLSFVFFSHHLAKLSALGTGLLLGTALGVIIPEGVETLASSGQNFPTSTIALSLLVGFIFMLIAEQLISGNTHPHESTFSFKDSAADVQFDMALDDREQGASSSSANIQVENVTQRSVVSEKLNAFPLTLGLVIHGLADGFALGVSSLPMSGVEASSNLSLVVFLALLVHRAPTALALTTSLLTTSLSRTSCRRHIAMFSASTPLGAIVSYELLSIFGGGQGDWPGIALLISGGTFLYVATVLQPVSHDSQSPEMSGKLRALFITAGMFIPHLIGIFLGHTHTHENGGGLPPR